MRGAPLSEGCASSGRSPSAQELRMPLRVVVLGMMGRCPFGGQTWLYLNWLRGLARLGHEVWYVEDDTVWPYDPVRNDCHRRLRVRGTAHRGVHQAHRTARSLGLPPRRP